MPVTVILPDLPGVPPEYRGKKFTIPRLLLPGNTNAKLRKGEDEVFRSWGLSLAPHTLSGYNLCVRSTPGCRKDCLHFQGHSFFPSVQAARIARAIAFKEKFPWFKETLLGELDQIESYSEREGIIPCVRLNMFSDVAWEKVVPEAFERTVTFYDYSKILLRMMKFCRGEFPENYHLTFSRSEKNESECREVLAAGGNVAVVFRGGLPKRWMGVTVIDGDVNDWRFNDPRGVVVGLRAKGTARRAIGGFVVDSEKKILSLPLLGG